MTYMVSTGRSFVDDDDVVNDDDDDDGRGTPSMSAAVFPGDSLCIVFAYPQ
jgi:hypothetical protein